MNEYQILFHLLSKTKADSEYPHLSLIGSVEEDLLKHLGLSGKHARIELLELLNEFSKSISLFGLQIRQNPLNHYWFLEKSPEIREFFGSNVFLDKRRLAATLCTALTLGLTQTYPVPLDVLRTYRKKSDVSVDLSELEALGFLYQTDNFISFTPYLAYHLDFNDFLQFLQNESTLISQFECMDSEKPSDDDREPTQD